MSGMPSCWRAFFIALLLAAAQPACAHASKDNARLPVVGPAPPFELTAATGQRLALADLRGKVLAITFIYATCADTCPMLTAKMVEIQRRLGSSFGQQVRFVAITVDPEVDTPEVLRDYAKAQGAIADGWSFLSGTPGEIKEVLRRYGVYAKKSERGSVDHLFLTSLIDRKGMLRVQYLGVRFDPGEMHRDVRKLMRE